ncbi:MAG: transposase [Elusimicrobia bacterium]|nr:transposase [Elusimicrobiota bacterium]
MRRPSCSVTQRNQDIVKKIKNLKSDHPFWGYRRIWARLKYDEHMNINKKRVLRLMRRHDLLVKPNLRL